MCFERLTPPAQGETYRSVSESLQTGLRHLSDLYGIGMPYRNGVQFDKKSTYFGFNTEAILFLHPSSRPLFSPPLPPLQVQMNGFEDAFNINTKNSPKIALNHNGTVFTDASGYAWKVAFTNKKMSIYCEKCLKLAARTSYCKAVKDRILRLQQAA